MIMFAVFLWIRKRDRERSINFAKVKKQHQNEQRPQSRLFGIGGAAFFSLLFSKKEKGEQNPCADRNYPADSLIIKR